MNDWANRVYLGSCESMADIPDASVSCCVTSPPYYGLREYDHAEQIGHERTVAAYVERLVGVFREVRRTLRDDGTLWLNLGDSYSTSGSRQGQRHGYLDGDRDTIRRTLTGHRSREPGLKNKDLIGVPWRVAFALQADGWYLRDAIVWAKPNPMPSSVTDRCTSSYEMVFMLAKSKTYYANMDAVREPFAKATLARIEQARWKSGEQAGSARANGGAKTNGTMKAVVRRMHAGESVDRPPQLEDDPERYNDAGANLRNVWTIATTPYTGGDHPAVMPRELATRCIIIGSPPNGVVLDPFMGSGVVAECAASNGRTCRLRDQPGVPPRDRTAARTIRSKCVNSSARTTVQDDSDNVCDAPLSVLGNECNE